MTVDVHATCYEVSILPRDDINRASWSLTVEYRGHGGYAVVDGHGRRLSRAGKWEWAPALPNLSGFDEWTAEHRFPLEVALKLAAEHAPHVRCNGKTATELLEWLAAQEPVGGARHE